MRKTWDIPPGVLADSLTIGSGPRPPVSPGPRKKLRSEPDELSVIPSVSDPRSLEVLPVRHVAPAPVGMATLTGIARPRVVNGITDTELNMLMFDPPVRPPVAVNTATMTTRALDGASTGAPLAGSVGLETAEMPRYADAPSRRQTIASPPLTRTGFLPLDQNTPPRPRPPAPQPVPHTPAPFPVQRPAADQHTEILPPVADATSGSYGLAAWLDRE